MRLCSVLAAGSSTWYVNLCLNEQSIVGSSCKCTELVSQLLISAQPSQRTQAQKAGKGRGGERERQRSIDPHTWDEDLLVYEGAIIRATVKLHQVER